MGSNPTGATSQTARPRDIFSLLQADLGKWVGDGEMTVPVTARWIAPGKGSEDMPMLSCTCSNVNCSAGPHKGKAVCMSATRVGGFDTSPPSEVFTDSAEGWTLADPDTSGKQIAVCKPCVDANR